MKKQAVLSLSGGMDSSTLLLRLLREGYEVTILSFNYGQKHSIELERAKELVQYLESKDLLKPGSMHILDIKLQDLLHSSLIKGGIDVPEGHYEADNMKATVVPNRNKIFSSIIQAAALSVVNRENTDCVIAMGIHAGDHQIYPDCRQEFRDADYNAFLLGNWEAERVKCYTPYLDTDKLGILEDGLRSCVSLGLDFNEVYKRTNTSYKPYPSGNSDYKSASSVERIEAFIKLGKRDPIQYEDESGEVSWGKVVAEVSKILSLSKSTT